jgi:CDP-diacylglycerol--serine O-phosphatidyltransferase
MKEQKKSIRIKGTRKRRRLRYIAILPSLVTLMNGLCGFTAIILASQAQGMTWKPILLPRANVSFFALAGYMIFLGMIADVLDGHVARMSKSTSSFGAQLDSLCDVISFGIAPAFLMLKLLQVHVQQIQFENPRYNLLLGRAIYLIAIIYAMCAVIRLARFNVENKEDDSSHLSFAGLPSPPAAGTIVSMVILYEDFLPKITVLPGISASIWALPVIALAAGLLMVTRIPYPHIVNRILRGKKSFSTFILVLFVILLMIWNIQLAMALGFCAFVFYGIIRWLFYKLFPRKKKEAEQAQPNTIP